MSRPLRLRVADGPARHRDKKYPIDAVGVLSAIMIITYAIPSDLAIASLGSAGPPALLAALGAGFIWLWFWLNGARNPPSAMRWGALLLLLAGLSSYVAAALRPLPVEEVTQADAGVLRVIAWLGLLMFVCDGIQTRTQLDVLQRRYVTIVGLFALLGLAQFATGSSLIGGLSIPGLSSTQSFSNILGRNGFTRSASTAMHPLEYAVVLSMSLPLALNTALYDVSRPGWRRWWPVVAIGFASALSVSRSALLGLAVAVTFMFPAWSNVIRRWAILVIAIVSIAVYLLVPGLAGTVLNLFTSIGSDASASSRTASYPVVEIFFSRKPIFGRGIGTFLPEYRILDNEYLLFLIEVGVFGLIALAVLICVAIYFGRLVRQRASEQRFQDLGQALVASILSGAVLMAFFDAFSFPKAVLTLFLILGMAGAARRVALLKGDWLV